MFNGAAIAHNLYDFPPLYTKQQNKETLATQMSIWSEIITTHYKKNNLFVLNFEDATSSNDSVFINNKINRKVELSFVLEIVEFMVQKGQAQLFDPKTECLVLWKSIEAWATLLDKHIKENGLNGTIVTFYEMRSPESTVAPKEFNNIHPSLLLRILEFMEKSKRISFIEAAEQDEIGIKFSS